MILLIKQQVLNLLGLAKRAGKLVAGEDTVLNLLKQNKLKIVFVAADASEKQIDKFNKNVIFIKPNLIMIIHVMNYLAQLANLCVRYWLSLIKDF